VTRKPFGAFSSRLSRPAALILVAVLLPTFLLGGLQIFQFSQQARRDIERRALDRAERIMTTTDAELATQIASLQVLAASSAMDRDDVETYYERVKRVATEHSEWLTVILHDGQNNELFDLRRPFNLQKKESVGLASTAPLPVGGVTALDLLQTPLLQSMCPCTGGPRYATGLP